MMIDFVFIFLWRKCYFYLIFSIIFSSYLSACNCYRYFVYKQELVEVYFFLSILLQCLH